MKKRLLFLLLGLFALSSAFSQNRQITGTVVGADDGKPLPGVTIKLKGTQSGITTDVFGKYTISAPPKSVLVFSFIGYLTQEQVVPSSGEVNIGLQPDSKQLGEVVVVGYGTGRAASELVGTVSTVSGKQLENKPSSNALDALQGTVAGLSVLSGSGEPSSTPSIDLHGLGSLGADSSPLLVLDGIPIDIGTVLSLNPNDIKEAVVLKDASSTAIYGSRAANGVIYITTKQGSFNRPATVTLTSQYGVSNLANTSFFKKFLNAKQLENLWVEGNIFTQAQVDAKLAALPVQNADTKWYKYYYKDNAPFSNQNVSISGGGGKTTYYVSGGYLNNEGIAYGSKYNRYTLRSNLTSKVNDWLQFGLNLSLGYDQRQLNQYGANSTNRGLGLLAAPFYPAVDPSGKEYTYFPGWNRYNPKYLASVNQNNGNNTQFDPTGFIQITPIKGLTIRSQAGMDDYDYYESDLRLPSDLQFPDQGTLSETFTRGVSKTFTNTAEYKFKAASVHHFAILAGQEYLDGTTSSFNGSGQGLTDDRLVLLSNTTTAQAVSSSKDEYVYNSYFGRLNYDFNEKYYFEGSIRSDKSSRFGIDHRTGVFWSAGLAWNAKKESFLNDVSWINDLRLKANTGKIGNSAIGNYSSLQTVTSATYNGGSGFVINSAGDPDLTWEKQQTTTFGLTTSLLDNRVRLDLAYYIRKTSSMLIDVPFPYTSGWSSITQNTGTLQNTGLDIDLAVDVWKDKAHNGFFTPFIKAAINHNKVTSLFQGKSYWVIPGTGVSWVVGKPVSYLYAIYKGVNPQTGAPEWYQPASGDDQFKTTRKDPNAVTSDFDSDALQQFTGISQYPWLTGSFGFDAGYGNISVHAMFTYALGKHMINNDRYFYENPYAFQGYNQDSSVLDYWKKPGDIAKFPDINNYDFTQFDSSLIENASFMRLKDLTISYALPKSLLGSQNVIKGVGIFVEGRNLFTVTKYTGPDPEPDTNLSLGAYPNTKEVSLGVNVTF